MYQNSAWISHWDKSLKTVLSVSLFFVRHLPFPQNKTSTEEHEFQVRTRGWRKEKESCRPLLFTSCWRNGSKSRWGKKSEEDAVQPCCLFSSTRIRHNPQKLAPLDAGNGTRSQRHVWETWVVWGFQLIHGARKYTAASTSHQSAGSGMRYEVVLLEVSPGHYGAETPRGSRLSPRQWRVPWGSPSYTEEGPSVHGPSTTDGTMSCRGVPEGRILIIRTILLIRALSHFFGLHMHDPPNRTGHLAKKIWWHWKWTKNTVSKQ